MKPIDFNCDLGEGEASALTEALCRHVTSINVACGGHAGDLASMRHCIGLAARFQLRLGAHPGLPGHFGRGPVTRSPSELATLIFDQVTGLRERMNESVASGAVRVPLRHVKLHGSLYPHAEDHPEAAEAFAAVLASRFPGVAAVGMPGRAVESACRQRVPFLAEGFLDRAYRADGSLVPRSEPGAVIHSPALVLQRLREWIRTGEIVAITGEPLRLPVQTWCLHSDTPGILEIAQCLSDL